MPDIGYPITVEVDAQGNIIPQGIDLQAGTNNTPPNQDRIRWLSQADGSVVAQELAYETGSGPTLSRTFAEETTSPTGTAESILQAVAGSLLSQLLLESIAATSAQIIIQADATTYLLGDNVGRSNFLQLAHGAQKMLVCRGVVDPTGAILSGEGFTVVHTATGVYTITFARAFATVPAVAVTPLSQVVIALCASTTGGCVIETFTPAVAPDDSDFSFIAIG